MEKIPTMFVRNEQKPQFVTETVTPAAPVTTVGSTRFLRIG